MKILLTGISGFIGKHLARFLQSQGYNIYPLKSDLMDFQAVAQEILQQAPDIVVHLAARTEVETSFYEQTSFSLVNYVGTVNLVESVCQLPRLPYFVFASTMEVYGWQSISDRVQTGYKPRQNDAFDELTDPHPNAPYAVAKYACEKYLEYANRVYALDYCILRQTNAFGREDNNFFVTEQIIWQMLNNQDKISLGYATPYRNFIYIDDVVKAWLTVINQRDRCKNQIFTMGPNHSVQIHDHAMTIGNLLGWHGEICWNTRLPRPGEIYYLCSRHDKLTAATGWYPRTSYLEGLEHTIDIWRQNLLLSRKES